MAFTLGQFAKLETDPLRKGIIQNLLREGPLLEKLPFENVNSLESVNVRWASLPSVAFRRINQGYSPNEGDYEQVYESVYGFGGEIEFDRVFDKITNTIIDPQVDQMLMKTKALALTFNDYFMNGDHANDPDGFEGIKKRISLAPARQTVDGSSDTSALDVTASAANARRFIDKWEESMYKANSGQVSVICVNESMLWSLGRALRFLSIGGGSIMNETKDQFDRTIHSYKGAMMVDAGLKTDQETEIIALDEDPGDDGGDATSAYFVPFNIEHGIMGIQLGDIDIYDPLNGGERESKPTKLQRLDWWVGLAGFGSHGAVRLNSIMDPGLWT